jgi:hypothetical protein
LFNKVELSPRWLAAGKKDVSVTTSYGPSGKQVSYRFQHDAGKRTISLSLSGDPELYTVRVLLPAGSGKATATLNGKAISSSLEKVSSSNYIVISSIGKGSHQLQVSY